MTSTESFFLSSPVALPLLIFRLCVVKITIVEPTTTRKMGRRRKRRRRGRGEERRDGEGLNGASQTTTTKRERDTAESKNKDRAGIPNQAIGKLDLEKERDKDRIGNRRRSILSFIFLVNFFFAFDCFVSHFPLIIITSFQKYTSSLSHHWFILGVDLKRKN